MTLLSKPTDPGLSVDQMYDWYRVHIPNEPAIVYLDENDAKTNITWKTLGNAILKGAEIINHEFPELQNGNPTDEPLVLAILANTDSPTYLAFTYAHFRLTHPSVGRPVLPFLMSTRNSPLGVADLFKNTKTYAIWTTDGSMRNLVEEALKTNPELKPRILTIPSFKDLYHPQQEASVSAEYDSRPVLPDTPLTIVHSSGSTAFPKPRTLRHIISREVVMDTERWGSNLEGAVLANFLPIYHAFGLCASFFLPGSRAILALDSPYKSRGSQSSQDFLRVIMTTEAMYMVVIPAILEEWCKNQKTVEYLQTMKQVVWGGGPLNSDVGHYLWDQGVPLSLLYGTTETMLLCELMPPVPIKEGYEWFMFARHINVHFAPTDEPDEFQVVIVESDDHHLSVYNTQLNGSPAWDTNDIVVRHPTNPTIYRFAGRSDDQIVLGNGQKTNPGPLETIIRRNPHIHDVLYFGRGRASNGILIQPKSFEEVERLGIPGFRNLIWQGVEEANAYAPTHSRVLKEMILIAEASKPFLYTAKESLRKGVMLTMYQEEIDELYKQSENSVRADVPIPLGTHPDGGWTETESRQFVNQVIHLVMEDKSKNMNGDDDIFTFGCDSLLATYIRNTLINALRQVAPPPNIDKLPTNFVYQSPTIAQLSKLLAETSRFELSTSNNEPESREARKHRLETVISRFTQKWPIRKPEKEMGTEEVVLLTGTTGALGSHMLVHLINLPTVKKIYAVNHRTGQLIYERHVAAFTDRGHDLKLLESEKVVLVEGEVSVPEFGVDPKLYEEMRVSVTTIIHIAWKVNFMISLASYEPAIRGVQLLIHFALSSPFVTPPKLLFTSSIGNIKPWTTVQSIPESPFLDIDQINPTGYAESKWICERILTIAGEKTDLEPVIVRVGQMAGGDAGDWNVTEWFPNLVAASQRIESLPSYTGTASFLLLPTAATAMLELRHASIRFAHLVNPKPPHFNHLIKIMSDELEISIISYNDWLKRLELLYSHRSSNDESGHDVSVAEYLIDFYRISVQPEGVKLSENSEVMGLVSYETTKTVQAAPTLRETTMLGRQQVERWLAYWRRKKLLK